MHQNNILLLVSKLYASQNILEWLMGGCFFLSYNYLELKYDYQNIRLVLNLIL